MKLTSELIKGFTEQVLQSRFDNPKPTPQFHEELWEMCCLDDDNVAIAAPRGHAKSTSVTLSYALACALFRQNDHILIVSDTERQASQFLGDIAIELAENEALIDLFGESEFEVDNATELIVRAKDGYRFRILAKGSEQKVRGLKWRNKRPNLILGDDLENDEIVMNKERREKFLNWAYKALLPCGSDDVKIRIVGTILHMDSFLEGLLNDSSWTSIRYRAHNEDFSEILWPEKFSRERLEGIRKMYVEKGMPEGYSQEYLNYPIDEDSAYFKRDDFQYYKPEDIKTKHLYHYSAVDFAISDKEHSDFTVITTVGIDAESNMYVIDVKRGRWDSKEIIDNIFDTHIQYRPEIFTAESGMIEKSIGPFLREEMFKKSIFINLNPMVAIKDKQSRARSLQARMRMKSVYFDIDAHWYPDLEQELLRFPRDKHDDQVDSLAWIGLTLDKYIPGLTMDEEDDENYEEEYGMYLGGEGKSVTCGY